MSTRPIWLIRPLEQRDLPVFRTLRLQALRDHPDAFGSSFEEEEHDDLSRLIGKPPNLTLGGFVDGEVVGSAGLMVPAKIKQRHKGHIVGVYLVPKVRHSGLAAALMDVLITHARDSKLIVLTLTVTVGNESARRLYLNAGFTVYGVEPAGLRIGADLLDEELMALRLG